MKVVFLSFGLLMAVSPMFAQNIGKDSISSTKALGEVTVTASNINRVGGHLVIYPKNIEKRSLPFLCFLVFDIKTTFKV